MRRQAAGEETGFELILVDKEGNIYISPSLSSSVSLAEDKTDRYRLAETHGRKRPMLFFRQQ